MKRLLTVSVIRQVEWGFWLENCTPWWGDIYWRYILMITRSNRTAVTVWDSNQRRGSVLTN